MLLATPGRAAGPSRVVCRCHWPTLFGRSDPFSDCDVQLACDGGAGQLVHKTTGRPLAEATPPVDIHDYRCSACARCNEPGPDPDTGLPSCVPRAFGDRDGDLCLYGADADEEGEGESDVGEGEDFRTTRPMLAVGSRFVDSGFASAFTDRARRTARVPNPCAFDLFTGARLRGDCELRMTRASGTAYCAPARDNVCTAVKDDTYLTNNGARYPNACFRFAADEALVDGFVVEYFLRERAGPRLPAPVVSARIAKRDVSLPVLEGLGLTRELDDKALLFTQPEPPHDVAWFPHPFDPRRMAAFAREENVWLSELPAKCKSPVGVLYNCSAPVQPLAVPACSAVGESDRDPSNKYHGPRNNWFGDQTAVYARSVVACTAPDYDRRFPIVPNYGVTDRSTDAEPASAVLFFDKTDDTVRPHWRDSGADPSLHRDEMSRYVREQLRSLPNERL